MLNFIRSHTGENRLVYITRENGLHIWVGPFGLHLYGGKDWHWSNPDFCRNWREPIE